MRVITGNKACGPVDFSLDGSDFSINPLFRLVLENTDNSEILATDRTGNPIFTEHAYGEGRILFFAAPIETIVATHTGMMVDNVPTPYIQCYPFYKIYRALHIRNTEKIASCEDPFIGLTEHILDKNTGVSNDVM